MGFGGGERADGREGHEATIAVEETLKEDIFTGEPYRRLRVHVPYPAPVLAGWKDGSHRLLVALNEEAPISTTVIDLSDENLEVLAADFTLLRDPRDVIRIAKETVRRMPAAVRRIHTFWLEVPREVLAGTRWAKYDGTFLSVPVDERLQKRAQDGLRSEGYARRFEGARALRYFRSGGNIALVKALLDDPGWAYLHRAEENQGLEVRIYGVREEAYRTLKSWGVDVEMPVIREEIPRPERVKIVDLSNTRVTDADLKGLARFENLQELFLRNTPVTDASLKELVGLKNLRTLYLSGTRVTDECLKVLAGLRSLQTVDLGQARVTDEGVAELRRLRPELRVVR